MVEPRLIEACIREDRLAQSELYRRCFPVLMGICMRYCRDRDEASAILNEGFLKILRGLRKRAEQVPFEAWIRRIMINTVIDAFRKARRERETMQALDEGAGEMAYLAPDYNEAERRLDAEQVEAMIASLPLMTRQVFNLFAIDGYSHQEIAAMLQISEGTSKWHVHAARSRVAEMIRKQLQNPKPVFHE